MPALKNPLQQRHIIPLTLALSLREREFKGGVIKPKGQ
jgi:hypothetical protein